MKISVVVAVGGNDIERYINMLQLLKSLKSQTLQPYELIIVEQRLNDGTYYFDHIPMDIENTKFIPIRFKDHQDLFCVGWGRNVGIYRATGDIVVCLDVDYVFDNQYLEAIANAKISNFCVGWSKIYYINPCEKRTLIQAGAFPVGDENYKNMATTENKNMGGSQIFNRIWFMENIVGYSEDMFGWGCDDSDVYGRCFALTGQWNILDQTIYHLHHDRKQKNLISKNNKIKERNCDNPILTAQLLKQAGVGNADHPNPIYSNSIEEASN